MSRQKQTITIPKTAKLKRLAKKIREHAREDVLARVFTGAGEYERGDDAAKAAWMEQAVIRLAEATSKEECIRILQYNGGECCGQKHSDGVLQIKKQSGSMIEFINKINSTFIFKLYPQVDQSIIVEYPKCYCVLVKKAAKPFSDTLYCHCSTGFLKKLLEPALGKPVTVRVVHSVITGGPNCRFHVTFDG